MITLTNVTRTYRSGNANVRALDRITATIADREFVSVTGPSGCGKSTLLNLLGGLDRVDSGQILVGDFALERATERDLTRYRRHHLGIVFQFFNLLPAMTIVENVELPLLLQGVPRREMRTRATELLDLVGIATRASHFPSQLSGGEMQRAAIARALVHRPTLLLADEPTGNLDSANAHRVLEALTNVASQNLATMVIVTHSEEVAKVAPRRISLLDGQITHA